ncbi:TPA: hypothetical protein H1012_03515 [archaeon]|nr:hypothetical protein [Candidatus Naiadarchaeales archaeon SRR2090159.bin1288]
MAKIKQFFTDRKILILLIILSIAILAIPSYKEKGVEVSYVFKDSPFYGKVIDGDLIKSVNSQQVKTIDDYASAVLKLKPNDTARLVTSRGTFSAPLNETVENQTVNLLGINVRTTTPYRLKLGLELQGGARVTLQPVTANGTPPTDQLYENVATVLAKRLDSYGLQGVIPRIIQDYQGNRYIVVEMAGEGSEKLVDLVKSVGKFELVVLNQTIFGGEAIVPPVGEPVPTSSSGGWGVGLNVRSESAEHFRDEYTRLTPDTPESCTSDASCDPGFQCARSEFIGEGSLCLPTITMKLDNRVEFAAPPALTLYRSWEEGEPNSNLVVQTGTYDDAKRVQVVLEAGQLPNEIESINVISQDYVDPKLGKDFFRSAAIAGLGAIALVGIVIFARYRKLKIALPILFTGVSEVVILVGLAAIFRNIWVLDLPAIAGIIATVGIGIEQQLIITDEILAGNFKETWEIRRKTKTAFGIIVVAMSTTVAAMLPLLLENIFPGLFALKGFAISTIVGVLIGYFITRPAYARMAEILLIDEQ